jgi:RsmE family RNA methyltransferase
MNIILFEKEELSNGHVTLQDHRAKHIVKILKSKADDYIRVGEINGKIGSGKIVSMKVKYPFEVELLVNLTEDPAPPPAIDLLLALPRPIMLKRILSQVTALGVSTIYLINANRVEKSFWDSGILRDEEYHPHLIHGLEQAVDTRLPELKTYRHFRPFVENHLPALIQKYQSCVIAHPDSGYTLDRCLPENIEKVLYAIGPEGGWVNFEVEKFLAAGMQPFSIGPRILKVDTAVVSIHGRISHELE